jgi:hypothetical protein
MSMTTDAILDRAKPIFEKVIPFRIVISSQHNADLTVRVLNGITVSKHSRLSISQQKVDFNKTNLRFDYPLT